MRIQPVLKFSLLGILLVSVFAGLVLMLNRGSQVRLDAEIVKTRAVATSEESAVLVAEVRLYNPAKVPFMIREVRTAIIPPGGTAPVDGVLVSQSDLDRLLGYFPAQGPRYNETLRGKTRIPGGQRQDFTVAASFPLPEPAVANPSKIRIEIEDVDGVVVTLESGK